MKPVEMDPAPSAETERIASLILVMPARFSDSLVRTVTGDGVSVLVRRRIEPVTTISLTASSAGWADGAGADGARA